MKRLGTQIEKKLRITIIKNFVFSDGYKIFKNAFDYFK